MIPLDYWQAEYRVADKERADLRAKLAAAEKERDEALRKVDSVREDERAAHELTRKERDDAELLRDDMAIDYRAVVVEVSTLKAERDALKARVEELEALFQQTHGVHHGWVARGVAAEAQVAKLTAERDEWRHLSGMDCDGMNCPPSDALKAQVATLKGMLERVTRHMEKRANSLNTEEHNQLAADCRAALSGDSAAADDARLRAFGMKVAAAVRVWIAERPRAGFTKADWDFDLAALVDGVAK